jgi:glutamate synthase (NADPH/NADH) large chain
MAGSAQYNIKDLDVVEPELAQLPVETTTLLDRQQAFGYTQEDISKFLEPMGRNGDDPIGSMGTDTPIAVLSRKSRLLYDYFKQNFAQVTNPPIDPIREELVMSLVSMIGPRPNLLGKEAGTHKRLEIDQPILTNEDVAKIRSVEAALTARSAPPRSTPPGTPRRAPRSGAGDQGNVLGRDRSGAGRSQHPDPVRPCAGPDRIPMPALLATAAIHHHLVRQGLRMQAGLVVETGEAREVHHFCVLAGFGAEAINPYVAFETLEDIRVKKELRSTPRR